MTPLAAAARSGDEREVLSLLSGGACGPQASAALWLAAEAGMARCVELLLGAGADARAMDSAAFRMACSAGRLECAELLLLRSDPGARNWEALLRAAEGGAAEIVGLIGSSAPAEVLREALLLAAENGRGRIVGLLLRLGADCSWRDGEALVLAAGCGCRESVALLLSAGCSAAARDSAALRAAAAGGHAQCAQALLAAGAESNSRGCEALRLSAELGRIECARVLAEHSDFDEALAGCSQSGSLLLEALRSERLLLREGLRPRPAERETL